jgi:hypothetical protein
MARRRKRLSDNEIRSICEQELSVSGAYSADLADERTTALDYYLGEKLGNEVDGRSQVRTREVLDTVEWVKPSLMRIFADAENICRFEAVGPEDEEAAQQETDAVEHVFWRENRGFHNLYSFVHDGLLTKTGILKVWWDETPDEEREEYENLNEWELAALLQDETRATEVLDWGQNEDGTYNVTVLARRSNGSIRIEPCPPEEFGVSRDARSIYPEDCPFTFHRTRLTKAELVDMGYEADMVAGLPASQSDVLTQERNARRYLSDEQDQFGSGDHWSIERVWVTECYLRIDRDGDGHAELLCVKLAGQDSNYASGSTVLDIYEVDRVPFVTWSPVIRTHTFYGLSMADLVLDLQEISTALTRQMLDNTYLANNGRTAVNERVNLDDLLTSRPGGIVRVEGADPPSNSLMPIPQQPVPPQAFEMLERLDEMRQKRTGVGDEVAALDNNSLAQLNTGVAALAYDASRSKVELMARVCGEVGLRPLFLRIHELLRKHASDKTIALRQRNGWVQVRPQEWRERRDMTVQVGVGQVSRERRLIALEQVILKQGQAAEAGALGVIMTPENLYRSLSDYSRELGVEESLYWTDPRQIPPRPPQPDYQAALVQVQQGAVEAQMQRNQVEALKVASTERMRVAELAQKERELELKAQIEQLKADLVALRGERDQSTARAKLELDMEIAAREQQLQAAELRLENSQEVAKREADVYKQMLSSGTTLTQEAMRLQAQQGTDAAAVGQMVREAMDGMATAFKAELDGVRAAIGARSGPRAIKRDSQGLIVSIGDMAVQRDDSGRMVSIG